MSIITNIIHDEFALIAINANAHKDAKDFERAVLNNSNNIMMSISGNAIPQNYMEAFKMCTHRKEAIALLQNYTNSTFHQKTLETSDLEDNTKDTQQVCLCYFDESKQKFCSYTVSVSSQHRSTDIKYSVAKQLLYRCVGSESEQLTTLFQLKAVRSAMQNFALQGKGVNDIMEVIDITQKMYDTISLIDHNVTLTPHSQYWAIDADSKTFKQIDFHRQYYSLIHDTDTQNAA